MLSLLNHNYGLVYVCLYLDKLSDLQVRLPADILGTRPETITTTTQIGVCTCVWGGLRKISIAKSFITLSVWVYIRTCTVFNIIILYSCAPVISMQ